jgi:glyoxylase I family protein
MAAIDHLSLTVCDVGASLRFYRPVLEFLGYKLLHDSDQIAIWKASSGPGINLWQAKPELASYEHRIYAPGYHHLAFAAESRDQVDALFAILQRENIKVLNAPQVYDRNGAGYYAVFFSDPDGMKFELAFVPPRT